MSGGGGEWGGGEWGVGEDGRFVTCASRNYSLFHPTPFSRIIDKGRMTNYEVRIDVRDCLLAITNVKTYSIITIRIKMLKPIIWTKHAAQSLIDREIDRSVVEKAIREPELTVPEAPDRLILMRRYQDTLLQKEMLIRVVIAERETTITVITVYKTSQIGRYLKQGK